VTYTLVVTNGGPSDATGVTVDDSAAAGLSVDSAIASQGSCSTTLGVVCKLGALASGGAAQILVTATATGAHTGTLTNTATVTGDQPDPDHANNSSSASITVPAPPQPVSDLEIVKRVNLRSAQPGQKLTYTLTVTNHGPDPATDTKITDTTSGASKLLSVKPSQGSCHTSRAVVCSLGTLANQAKATITETTEPRDTGTQTNTATITSASKDPDPDNNVSHATTKVHGRLLLRKIARPGAITTGQRTTFDLRVSDPSSVALSHVTVCDAMPHGLLYVASNPIADRRHGRYCWNITTIPPRSSRAISIQGEASLTAHGALVNDATATAPATTTAHAQATVHVTNTANGCGNGLGARVARITGSAGSPNPTARIAC
jgi:uncharacterized repeat protein (TIGR01451 family)